MSHAVRRNTAWLALVMIAALAWTLDTHNAAFPFQYHGDEGSPGRLRARVWHPWQRSRSNSTQK